jgi:hypothetical protein
VEFCVSTLSFKKAIWFPNNVWRPSWNLDTKKLQMLSINPIDWNRRFMCVTSLSSNFVSQSFTDRYPIILVHLEAKLILDGLKNWKAVVRMDKGWAGRHRHYSFEKYNWTEKLFIRKVYSKRKARPTETNFQTPTVASDASELQFLLEAFFSRLTLPSNLMWLKHTFCTS